MDQQKLYANSVGVRMSGQDFLILCATKDKPQEMQTADDADVKLFISPFVAKTLAEQLGKSIAVYEDIFGEIVLNPDPQRVESAFKNASVVGNIIRADGVVKL